MRRLIVISSALRLLKLLGIAWLESQGVKPVAQIPTLTGYQTPGRPARGNRGRWKTAPIYELDNYPHSPLNWHVFPLGGIPPGY